MVEGTATLGSPELMNCSIAIWAVASCIATLSGLTLRVIQMRVEDLLGQGHGSVQPRLDHLEVFDELLVGHGGLLIELGHGRVGHDGCVETSLLRRDDEHRPDLFR